MAIARARSSRPRLVCATHVAVVVIVPPACTSLSQLSSPTAMHAESSAPTQGHHSLMSPASWRSGRVEHQPAPAPLVQSQSAPAPLVQSQPAVTAGSQGQPARVRAGCCSARGHEGWLLLRARVGCAGSEPRQMVGWGPRPAAPPPVGGRAGSLRSNAKSQSACTRSLGVIELHRSCHESLVAGGSAEVPVLLPAAE